MRTEFVRYGLGGWRPIIGALQLAGAIGLIIGNFYLPILGFLAACGLSLLMILGFGVRLKIEDNLKQSAPSFLFALINALIAILIFKNN